MNQTRPERSAAKPKDARSTVEGSVRAEPFGVKRALRLRRAKNARLRSGRWPLFLLTIVATACASDPTPPVVLPTLPPVVALTAPTSTPRPTQTQTLTLTLTPLPTSTPAPTLRQLTTGCCCVQPFWSPDGAQVWFIDRPNESSPSGIWGVNVSGGEPQFIADRVGVYSPDRSLVAYPEGGQTYVEQIGGERWRIANAAGRAISFSPDSRFILWQAASSSENFDRRIVEVWMANADGSESRVVARLIGGGVSGWLPDGQRLLVSGRESLSDDPYLAALRVRVADGGLTIIARGPRLRGGTLSPEGGWVVYQITFSGDAAQDGLWVARTDGSEARRLEVFGAYRWRSEGKLLMIPLETNAASHRLLEVEAASGAARALTDPSVTPFRVAGGDWSVSPDGSRVVFVSADDHNLWVIDLPPP